MRRPTVVTGTATAMLLAGGVLLATTAGAGETPEIPSLPGASGHPAIPGLPSGGKTSGSEQRVSARDVSADPAAPVQQRVLTLVNRERRTGGCDPLTPDRRLTAAANAHAADMARHDYFAHRDRTGGNAGDRVSATGYDWRRYGENIARGQDSAAEVVDGWMGSPSHRANILDCALTEMGVGLSFDATGKPYWVQDFATPKG